MKYSKECEENDHDAAWKVRTILEIFLKNVKQFGYFKTAVSVNEMMIRFFGRVRIKKFILQKPTRWDLKMWALCGSDGYLFDCDLYCGKNQVEDIKLSKLSEVVLLCK